MSEALAVFLELHHLKIAVDAPPAAYLSHRPAEVGSGPAPIAAEGQPTGRVLPRPVAVGVYPGRLGGWQAVRSETGLVRLAPRIRPRSPSGAAGGTRSKAVVLEMER